jgi:hypothetical protein
LAFWYNYDYSGYEEVIYVRCFTDSYAGNRFFLQWKIRIALISLLAVLIADPTIFSRFRWREDR